MEAEIRTYASPNDDIKNTWLDIDVSGAILSARSHGMTVCLGSSTTKAAEDLMSKDGKGYMVRIQKARLVKEMLGQRARLRKAVFEEQARQKQEGILDIDAMEAVASAQSKWGVEVAKSSWFLHNLPK
jgi:CO/xanthine dehydrogenase Mo-binding subunit